MEIYVYYDDRWLDISEYTIYITFNSFEDYMDIVVNEINLYTLLMITPDVYIQIINNGTIIFDQYTNIIVDYQG